MILKIIMIFVAVFYSVCNLVMAYKLNADEMYNEIIVGQCTVGMIFANIFYAPAWILKGLRKIVLVLVR